MPTEPNIDFLSVGGEVFAQVVWDTTDLGDPDPHDFYEVFLAALGLPLDSDRLARMTSAEFERVQEVVCEELELDEFPIGAVHEIVEETLRRWPADVEKR